MRRLVICVALAMLGPAVLCRAEATDAGNTSQNEIRQRAETLLSDPGFQKDLPGVGSCEAGDCDRSSSAQRRRPTRDPFLGSSPERQRPRFEMRIPEAGGIAKIALWLLVAVGLATLVGSFAAEARKHRRRHGAIEAAEHAPSRPLNDDLASGESPETLASSGRYAEAAHLLLGQVLRRLSGRLALEHSLTSREILARPKLASRRESLAILVETVERSWFGGSSVDRETYERCLEASRHL